MGANLLKELIIDIRAFAQKRDWDQFHSPKNLAMALSVEVAEVVEHFQCSHETLLPLHEVLVPERDRSHPAICSSTAGFAAGDMLK